MNDTSQKPMGQSPDLGKNEGRKPRDHHPEIWFPAYAAAYMARGGDAFNVMQCFEQADNAVINYVLHTENRENHPEE